MTDSSGEKAVETKQVRIQKNGMGAGILAVLARHYGVPEATILDAVLVWLGQNLALGLAICESETDPAARDAALADPDEWGKGRWLEGVAMADRLAKAVTDSKAAHWDAAAAEVAPAGLIQIIDTKARQWRAAKSERAKAAAAKPRRRRQAGGSATSEAERKLANDAQ